MRPLVLCSALASPVLAAKNVLWIIADDLKHMEHIPDFSLTPNIDRLRENGVEFLNANSQYSMCGPSRLSFLTGIAPHNIYNSNQKPGLGDREVCLLRERVRQEYGDEMLSINQMTTRAGISTHGYGKVWHGDAGGGSSDCPREKSTTGQRWSSEFNDGIPKCSGKDYDGRFCEFSNRVSSTYHTPGQPEDPFPKNQGSYRTNTYAVQHVDPPLEKEPNIYSDAGVNYRAKEKLRELMKKPDEPWMLVVGYYRPHLPFTVPARILRQEPRLDTCNIYPPALEPTSNLFKKYSPEAGEWTQYLLKPNEFTSGSRWDNMALRRGYFAAVRYVDSLLGELISVLEQNPAVRKDTAIILMGDHGFWIGDRTNDRNLNSASSSRTYGGYCKHSALEGAVRTTLLIDAPEISASRRGTKSEAPVELLDVYPTILDLLGVTDRPPQRLDGTSLMPILDGSKTYVKSFARSGFLSKTSFRTKRHRIFIGQSMLKGPAIPRSPDNINDVVDYVADPAEEESIAISSELRAQLFATHSIGIDPNGKEPFDKDGLFGSYCCDTIEPIETHLRK